MLLRFCPALQGEAEGASDDDGTIPRVIRVVFSTVSTSTSMYPTIIYYAALTGIWIWRTNAL